MTPKRIGLVGFEGVTSLNLIGPADAFFAAALDDGYGGAIPCYEVCIIGAPSGSFCTESGLTFTAAADLESAPICDSIIVAGGAGLANERLVEQIAEWLLKRTPETQRIGTVGAGLVTLASTGLLDGREVSAHWRAVSAMTQRFPRLKIDHKRPVVRDGCFYTCNGLTGGINLSLAMIREDYGPYVARAVAQDMSLYPPAENQTPRGLELARVGNHTTDRFADLVAWIVRNLHADLSVEVLARRACMSQDHFSKAFKSVFGAAPSSFVENLRLNEARRRLSKRQKTVQSVATSVGFHSAAKFQRAFERRFATRPSSVLDQTRSKIRGNGTDAVRNQLRAAREALVTNGT